MLEHINANFLHEDLQPVEIIYDGNFSKVYVVRHEDEMDEIVLKVIKAEEKI